MTQDNEQILPDEKSGKQKTILLLLAFVALASVFLLPKFVSEPWVVNQSLDGPVVPNSAVPSVAPSTAAEKTKYRQDSQSVLAQIIQLRDLLEAQSVRLWAPIEFQQGMDAVAKGDELYSYGEYKQALASYELTLASFTGLKELGMEKFDASLGAGFGALESLNLVVATEASELTSAMFPQDIKVKELASRLEILPELITQMNAGDQAKLEGDLGAAQAAYQKATTLDPAHKRASESLAWAKREIVENTFRQHMSRGYAALDAGDYEAAIAAFNQAGTVHPGHVAIAQGLAQVENRSAQVAVSNQISAAASLELTEEWAAAVEVYESLLAQDPTLTEAKVKLIPVRVRADLEQRITTLTEDPLKLAEQATFRQAQLALRDARGIPRPGKKLQAQISNLETLMKRAVTSVDVVFQSDNITEVTLFRVAKLGQFQETSLTLKPGRYIAAGTRQGFRDVRVEFSVTGEPLDGPIVVSCNESI